MVRIIGHLDMDAFFAAVEERDRPHLKGQPIVVGANPEDGRGRGVVSTANYKAREYGIHSAMPISRAWELSEEARKKNLPAAVFITPHGHHYGEVSAKIMAIVSEYVPKIERVSIDETFMDLSFAKSYSEAEKIATKIKEEIKTKEELTCSIGIGPNKLIAKIASDIKKPDGLTIITEDKIEDFLDTLSIRKIPGIGPKTEILLNQKGIKNIKDLKKFTKEELKTLLGKWGISLYEKSHGCDDSPVEESDEVKSIGEQETFKKDTLDPGFILDRLKELSASVFKRFSARGGSSSGGKNYKAITVTVRFAGFDTKNRSHTLSVPANDQKTLEFEAAKLLFPFFDKRENPQKKKIRLIGVRIEKLH